MVAGLPRSLSLKLLQLRLVFIWPAHRPVFSFERSSRACMAVTTAGDLLTASNLISLHYLGRIKAI